MLPDRVLNPGPLTYESGALPIALRGPAHVTLRSKKSATYKTGNIVYSYHTEKALNALFENM